MNIGVLGTGTVGATIAGALVKRGHTVVMGARSAANEKAAAWAKDAGSGASHGTFADAAHHGTLLFNCVAGHASLAALQVAGAANLAAKTLVDVSNPLDFSKGMPPALLHNGSDSLAEQIQRTFPAVRVVKALNTINCGVMVNPKRVPGQSDVFVAGNDAAAKAETARLLKDDFGWPMVTDLGDLTRARGLEAYVLFWVALWAGLGSADVNIRVIR